MKSKLRENKVCLNCGGVAVGRYCTGCGQENREPHESFGELLLHFFEDFTHFDSKIFITLKWLLLRPGFLTVEYLQGRRVRYLPPIRMYIFISLLFFLGRGWIKKSDSHFNNAGQSAMTIHSSAAGSPDSLKSSFRLDGLEGFINSKQTKWESKYGAYSGVALNESVAHALPKAMFFLLPLFALYLKWFFKRKPYYTEHAIFSLHFHSAAFLILLFAALLEGPLNISFIARFVYPLLFLFLVLSLKKVYQRTWRGTFFRAAIVSSLYLISLLMALVVTAFITFVMI